MKWGKDRNLKWTKWFAWYPIQVSPSRWVWLENIEVYYNSYWHYWNYREISE